MKTASFAVLFSLVVLFACGDGGQKKLRDKQVSPLSADKNVLAKVGDMLITQSDLDDILKSAHPILKSRYESLEGRKELLNKMIARAVLYSEGIKQGVQSEEKISKAIEDHKIDLVSDVVKTRFLEKELSDKAVENYFKKNKEKYSVKRKPADFESLKRNIRADLSRELVERYIDDLKKKFEVSINDESLNK